MNKYNSETKTDKTNEELVELIQQGIETEKNLELLFFKNVPFISSFFYKNYCYLEQDELMQESFFAVKEASEKCDISKAKFITYLIFKLRSCARGYLKSCLHRDISIETPINEEEKKILKDNLKSESDQFDNVIRADYNKRLSKDLLEGIKELTSIQREIIYKRYFENKSYNKITEEMNLKIWIIKRQLKNAFKILRESEALKYYIDEMNYSNSIRGVSSRAFERSRTSSVERSAFQSIEVDKIKRRLEFFSNNYETINKNEEI